MPISFMTISLNFAIRVFVSQRIVQTEGERIPGVVFFCFLVWACELAAGGGVGTGEEVVSEEVVRTVELLALEHIPQVL